MLLVQEINSQIDLQGWSRRASEAKVSAFPPFCLFSHFVFLATLPFIHTADIYYVPLACEDNLCSPAGAGEHKVI